MSELHPETADSEPVRTGAAEVDEVLESLVRLDTTDVSEHPAVYETAHERLRAALDGTTP